MHLSAESIVSNLNGEGGMIQLHYKLDDSRAYSQYKSIPTLTVPHVASKGPNTLDLTERGSEGIKLVLREVRREAVNVHVGGL